MSLSDKGVNRDALNQDAEAESSSEPASGELFFDGPLAPDVAELLTRSAALRRGLAFLHRAPIDSVAVSLGVHPDTVDRARDHLDRAHERKVVLREYARARESERPSAPPPPPLASEPPPSAPEDLIRAAHEHPLGVQFLLCAPLETTAITFAVHPDVVAEARGVLADRGIVPEPS